ncbi:MAG: hypothetical protein WCI55_13025 [Armatimonadota bacterium]
MKKLRKLKIGRDQVIALALAVCLGVSSTALAIVHTPRGDGLGWMGESCYNDWINNGRSWRECCASKCAEYWNGSDFDSCWINCMWKVEFTIQNGPGS